MGKLRDRLKAMDALFRQHLSTAGFRRLEEGMYTYPYNEQIRGSVGLNTAHAKGGGIYIDINPIIGVRHLLLEETIADLTCEPNREYTPSVLMNIGYLMPERSYRTWAADGLNDETIVQEVCDLSKQYVVQLLEDNLTLSRLLHNMLLPGYCPNDRAMYRIPTAYYLLGDMESAEQYLYSKIEWLGAGESVAAQQYRLFAKNLLSRLKG